MKKRRISVIPKDECVSCGSCEKVCPQNAITIFRGIFAQVDGSRCIGCGKCAKECPAGIITIEEIQL